MAKNDESACKATDRSRLTRRRALGVLGSGLLAGAVPSVSADDHEAEVWEDGGTWYAEAHGSEAYSGSDPFAAIQAAVDGLTDGRTSKETVVVRDGGTGSYDDIGVYLPSYTVLDVRGTLDLSGSGGAVVAADTEESIEIRTLSLEGSPSRGIHIQRSTDVVLGEITMVGEAGIGIRIDNAYQTGNAVTTENVRIESVDVTGTETHAVETYGVDDIEIGTVRTRDTGGSGLQFNDTSNASVEFVDAARADEGGGYAGFRCANDAGPDIHVEELRAVDCGRGIFTVSGSHGITIEEATIEGCGQNLIQDTRDLEINGGIIEGNGGEGIRIDSRSSGAHHHTRDVTVRNVGFYENSYGVMETGPDTEDNAIVDNDFCDNGTDLEIYADSTIVEGNTTCEGPPEDEDFEMEPVELDGYYRIEHATDDLALSVEDGSTEGEASIVTRPFEADPDQYWHVEHLDDGVHRIENEESGLVLDVYGARTDDGEDLVQWEWTGDDNQRFLVGTLEDGEHVIEAVHSELVLEGSDGRVVQSSWNAEDGQRWEFLDEEPSTGIELNGYETQDTTGSGLHNDVTGDGSTSHDDVTTFFEHVNDDAVQDNPEAFAFAGDEETVGFNDVLALFEKL